MKRKFCLSFRKFLIIKEYDNTWECYDYHIYGRIFPFVYIYLCDADDTVLKILEEF